VRRERIAASASTGRLRTLPARIAGTLVVCFSFLLGACDPLSPLEGDYVLERNTTGAGTGVRIARYVHAVDPALAPQEAVRLLAEVGLALPATATAISVENVEHEPSAGLVNTDPVIRYTLPLIDLDAAVGGRRLVEQSERSTLDPPGCFVSVSLDIVGADVPNCLKTGWGFHLGPAPTDGATPTAHPTPSPYVEVAAEIDGDLAHVTILIQAWPGNR
jgi:hypothetical protein